MWWVPLIQAGAAMMASQSDNGGGGGGGGNTAAPAGPTTAQSDNVFNSSGWTVNMGSGSAAASTAGGLQPWVVGVGLAVVLVIGVAWVRKG